MLNSVSRENLDALGQLITEVAPPVTFRIMEIGAAQITGQPEPFYQLLELFPGSEIIAFEVDDRMCDGLNAQAQTGVRYYPVALGEREETCPFY